MSSFAFKNPPYEKTQVKQDITQVKQDITKIIENLLETEPDKQFVDLNPFGNNTILVNILKDYSETKKGKPSLLSLRQLAVEIIEEERQKYDCFLLGQKGIEKNKEIVATKKKSKRSGLLNEVLFQDGTICEKNPPLNKCLTKGDKTKTASPKPKPPKDCGGKIGSIQPGKILRRLKSKKSPSPSSSSPTTVRTPPGILFSSPSSSPSPSPSLKSKTKTGGVRLQAKTRKKKYRSKTKKKKYRSKTKKKKYRSKTRKKRR